MRTPYSTEPFDEPGVGHLPMDQSSTQYDAIGSAYEKVKTLPMARYAEQGSFLALLGDLAGRSVLDLACGTGFYTRRVRQRGAGHTLGVDVSTEMIAVARAIEATDPLGVEYLVADAAELAPLGEFDVVSAVYLLNYADDEATMARMCRSAAANLVPGGSFLVLTQHPAFCWSGPQPTRYGFTFDRLRSTPIGDRVRITADLDPPVSFETNMTNREVYERALAETGFQDVTWVPLHVPEAALVQFGAEYWSDFLDNPPLAMLRAVR